MDGEIVVTSWNTRHVDPAAFGSPGNHACLWDIARERLAINGFSRPSNQQIQTTVNEIVSFHNSQTTRPGFQRINNPDRINDGQTLFVPPGSTVMPAGSKLQIGQQWTSADGKTALRLEPGKNANNEPVGKLNIYRDDGHGFAMVGSFEMGRGVTSVEVTAEGKLLSVDDKGQTMVLGAGGNKDSRLAVQNDGNVVLYGGDNRVLWSSGTQRRL